MCSPLLQSEAPARLSWRICGMLEYQRYLSPNQNWAAVPFEKRARRRSLDLCAADRSGDTVGHLASHFECKYSERRRRLLLSQKIFRFRDSSVTRKTMECRGRR